MMICSPVESINNLYIEMLPSGRAISIEKVARSGDTIIYLAKSGKLYTDRIRDFAYLPGKYGWMKPILKCLVKLKVVPQKDANAHWSVCEKADNERSKKYAAESLEQDMKTLGLSLTPKQRVAIDEVLGNSK